MSIILSDSWLEDFFNHDPVAIVKEHREKQRYDVISFGGGSCPKIVGKYANDHGWKDLCFLTNGSDNGGTTYNIVEALRQEYGPTLPVGDITSALISQLHERLYSLLNVRGWNVQPECAFERNKHSQTSAAIKKKHTFSERFDILIDLYKNSTFWSPPESEQARVLGNLHHLGKLVDQVGLIRAGVKGLDIQEASVRHHLFNAVMLHCKAYSSSRISDSHWFMVGLWLIEQALGINYTVFPCSIDEQVLYAKWIDQQGTTIWDTKRRSKDHPILDLGGQVALSNVPDSFRRLPTGEYARYGMFCFDPSLPTPTPYLEALQAIENIRPGRPILYGPSSFVASISPCLAVPEISKALSKRQDCPKILFLNLTHNNETVGMEATDYLDFWELATNLPISSTVDYVVINNDVSSSEELVEALQDKGDHPHTFKFRGVLALHESERINLPKRRITIVEAPLATVKHQFIRLSSLGERKNILVPIHHSQHLLDLAHCLTSDYCQRTHSPESVFVNKGNTKILLFGDNRKATVTKHQY